MKAKEVIRQLQTIVDQKPDCEIEFCETNHYYWLLNSIVYNADQNRIEVILQDEP